MPWRNLNGPPSTFDSESTVSPRPEVVQVKTGPGDDCEQP